MIRVGSVQNLCKNGYGRILFKFVGGVGARQVGLVAVETNKLCSDLPRPYFWRGWLRAFYPAPEGPGQGFQGFFLTVVIGAW